MKKINIQEMVFRCLNLLINENTVDELTAYHASGKKFKKFDLSYVGTGEGSQVYGFGVYLTSNEGSAKVFGPMFHWPKVSAGKFKGMRYVNCKKDLYVYICKKIDSLQELIHHTRGKVNLYMIVNKLYTGKEDVLGQYRKTVEKYINKNELSQEEKNELFSIYNEFEQKLRDCGIENSSEFEDRKNIAPIKSYYQTLACKDEDQFMYTVEIPEGPYLDWNNNDVNETLKLYNYLIKECNIPFPLAREENGVIIPCDSNGNQINFKIDKKGLSFKDIFNTFGTMMDFFRKNQPEQGRDKSISMALSKLGYVGIKVPIGQRHGGDGIGDNYVIFNEDDVKFDMDKDVKQFNDPNMYEQKIRENNK